MFTRLRQATPPKGTKEFLRRCPISGERRPCNARNEQEDHQGDCQDRWQSEQPSHLQDDQRSLPPSHVVSGREASRQEPHAQVGGRAWEVVAVRRAALLGLSGMSVYHRRGIVLRETSFALRGKRFICIVKGINSNGDDLLGSLCYRVPVGRKST